MAWDKEVDGKKMDEAAVAAIEKLKADMQTDPAYGAAVIKLAGWLKAWYAQAGYKRLCRGLLELAK